MGLGMTNPDDERLEEFIRELNEQVPRYPETDEDD